MGPEYKLWLNKMTSCEENRERGEGRRRAIICPENIESRGTLSRVLVQLHFHLPYTMTHWEVSTRLGHSQSPFKLLECSFWMILPLCYWPIFLFKTQVLPHIPKQTNFKFIFKCLCTGAYITSALSYPDASPPLIWGREGGKNELCLLAQCCAMMWLGRTQWD